MKELKEIIARNIYELRISRKITQFRLAEMLNYSDKAISKWERAESIPDIVVLKQIADYFNVTVDYLLCENHADTEKPQLKASVLRRNRAIITGLATSLVWLIATFLFVVLSLTIEGETAFPMWMIYVYSVPISAIVLLVFNAIWGVKKLNFVFITAILWSVLVAVYLSLLTIPPHLNLWLVFVIGCPGQLIIVLWSGLKKHKLS